MAHEPGTHLGPMQWRSRQLAVRGYNVVVVPLAEWQQLKGDAQVEYLRQRFEQAGVVLLD